MTAMLGDSLSLLFRGTDWSVQYAVARGARLASIKGGNLWDAQRVGLGLLVARTPRADDYVA
jgi:hypothetical protein